MENFYNQIKKFQELINGIDTDELILDYIVDKGIGTRFINRKNFPKKRIAFDSKFKMIINDIGYNPSFNIIPNDNCSLLVGIALACNYGEKARRYFHLICLDDGHYNKDVYDIKYSKYLLNKSTYIPIDIVYILYENAFQSQKHLLDYFND